MIMELSANGAHKLANHESFRDYVYDDKTSKHWDFANHANNHGFPTIGFGHLCSTADLVKYSKGLTREAGEVLFKHDLEPRIKFINDHVRVKLTQNQFDALVSLVFNIGKGAFGKSSVLRCLNQGDYANAASHFLDWRYDSHHDPVLLPRRREEQALFLKP